MSAGRDLGDVGCLVAGGHGELAERVAGRLAAAGARVASTGIAEGREQAEAAVAAAEAEIGGLGALVCLPPPAERAGIGGLGPELFDATLAAAFRAPFLLTQAMLPRLRASGRGRLLYVTSTLAIGGRPLDAHVAAAEHAVIGLMRTATLETEPPLTANAVVTSPGAAGEELDDLVDALCLLLRPASDYLTGQILETAGRAELHA